MYQACKKVNTLCPLNLLKPDPKLESEQVTQKAVEKVEAAANQTAKWLRRRTETIFRRGKNNILMGPNVDPTYYNWSPPSLGPGTEKPTGFPDLTEVSELHMLYQLDWNIRFAVEKKYKHSKIFVLKHFPGAPDEKTDVTESFMHSYPQTLSEAREIFTFPFIRIIDSPFCPKAIMINHCGYPKILRELRAKYPEYRNTLFSQEYAPASFSPEIVRGWLRNEIGYQGLIYSDWYNMGSIRQFLVKMKPVLPRNIALLSKDTLTIIFAVYAGINRITGVGYRPGTSDFALETKELEEYYVKNKNFAKVFDELARETLTLLQEVAPVKYRELTLGFEKLYFNEKLAILVQDYFPSELSVSSQPNSVALKKMLAYFDLTTDIWNRWGVITLKFRKEVVSAVSGKKFPEPDGTVPYSKWAANLLVNPKFRKTYDLIDWQSPLMLVEYNNYIERLAGPPKVKLDIGKFRK